MSNIWAWCGGFRGPELAPKPGVLNPCFCPFRFKFHCHFQDFLDSFQFFGFVYKTLVLDSPVSSAPPPQLKQLEVARAEKWLKMVKKWDKYKSSDRVSHRPQCLQTEEPDVSPMRKCITSHHKFHTENEQIFFCLFLHHVVENSHSDLRWWQIFNKHVSERATLCVLLFRERVLIFLSRGGAVEWAAFLLLFLLSLSLSFSVCLSLFVCVCQMVKRVYKGIPLQLRGRAWALMLDVEGAKKETQCKYEVCSRWSL